MSRAISLAFGLAIAVVIAGGMSLPAEARTDARANPAHGPERSSAPGATVGNSHQPRAGTPAPSARSSRAAQSASTASVSSGPGGPPAHASAASRRAGGPPTGVKARPEQSAGSPGGQSAPGAPPHARGPGAPGQVIGGPDAMPAESSPATVTAPPSGASTAPTTTEPVATMAPVSAPVTDTSTAPTPTSPTMAEPDGAALRLSVVGAWFGHQIHGLMASPPVLPRPRITPLEPPSAPTAFGLLFGLLGAWWILQRLAWNRLGHVPLTSPPGPGWDVAHG